MDALAKLGIDAWGIVLYLVNFGILLLVLQKFVYKPLIKMIDKRRETIRTNVDEAEALRKEFEEKAALREREAQEERKALESRVQASEQLAKKQAQEIIEDAEARRERLLADGKELIAQMRSGILSDVESETKDRIKKTVLYVLQDGVTPEQVEKSVEEGWQAIQA